MSNKSEKLYELILQIRPAYRFLSDAVEFELKGTGISMPMRAVMETISMTGQMSVPDLAHGMMIARQSVQPLVDKLLDDRLLEKLENPRSKKSSLWALTKKGSEQLSKIRKIEQQNLKNIDSEFKANEIEAAIKVLNKLTEKFSHFESWRNKP